MSVKFFSNLHEYFSSKSPGVFFNGRPAKPVLPDTSVAGAAAGAAQSADMMSSAASTDVVELGESAVELCSNSTPSDLTVEVKDTFILPVTDGELPNVEKKTKKSVKFPEDNGCLVTHYFPATKPFVHSIGSGLLQLDSVALLS